MVKVVADLVSVEDNFPGGWTGPSVRVGTGHVARGEGALWGLLHKDTHPLARAPNCDLLPSQRLQLAHEVWGGHRRSVHVSPPTLYIYTDFCRTTEKS